MANNVSNLINLFGGVVRVTKNKVNDERVVFNFTLAVNEGYGENETTTFFSCSRFAKKGAQEAYYDAILVKGAKLPVSGRMTTSKPYTDKNGSEVTPWVVIVKNIGHGINKVCVSGRLTADAKIAKAGESYVAKYTIAVKRNQKDAPSDFVQCTHFGLGGFSEFAKKYLVKGQEINAVGAYTTGSYQNKEGKTIYTTELKVADINLFGKKKDSDSDSNSNDSANTSAPTPTATSDNVPTNTDGFVPMDDDEEEDLPF